MKRNELGVARTRSGAAYGLKMSGDEHEELKYCTTEELNEAMKGLESRIEDLIAASLKPIVPQTAPQIQSTSALNPRAASF